MTSENTHELIRATITALERVDKVIGQFQGETAYIPKPQCKTCAYWKQDAPHFAGFCHRAMRDTASASDGASSMVIIGMVADPRWPADQTRYGLATTENFGCLEWKAK